jgi:hypothetical protein
MRLSRILMSLFVVAALIGCANPKKPLLPVHDEVLVYPLAYDLTYLRTLEALMAVSGWDLEITDKENGLIRVRNIDYTGLDNSDQRTATFLLKRVGQRETSIELARDSQQAIGAGALIKAVSGQLNREVQA